MTSFAGLRALEAKATPGPWVADTERHGDLPAIGSVWRMRWACRIVAAEPSNERRLEDAALIVAARNALPGLLARVDALEAERDTLREKLADAVQLVAKFEYLPYSATIARRVVDGNWVTDDEVAAECSLGAHVCPICTWPQRGHRGPGRYKGNAANSHEDGCSLRAVLDGEPAPRLRGLSTRALAGSVVSAGPDEGETA